MALGRRKATERPAPDESNAPESRAATQPAGAGSAIGTLLLQRGLISSEQLATATERQPTTGKAIPDVLVEMGAVSERDVVAAVGEQLGVPFVDLRRDSPDAEVVALLKEATARDLVAIPLHRGENDTVIVAAADPSPETATKLKAAMKTAVTLHIAPSSDIERAINNAYSALDSVGRLVDAFAAAESSRRGPAATVDAMPDDAPVVRIVNMLISQAVRDRTSDIHIEPQDENVRVRYRIDGALTDAVLLPEALGPAIISRIKIMAGLNIVERRRPQDGQINQEIDGRTLDIRVNTMPTIWGEKAVMRILDRKRTLHTLADLGMPPEIHAKYSKMTRAPVGMLVCAGPTGSGKTTTLYATLNEINNPTANITTLEDPVEFVFPSINQVQINEQAGMTFAGGLRAILRQDPDIILVGEIRDIETARLGVQAALTGHFVLSTIHANDSASALHRFVDMGIERFLIASSLSMVVSQRLLRRTCTHCRVPKPLTVDEEAFFAEYAREYENKTTFYLGEGCNFCSNTGYLDRVGVYELLLMTDDMRRLVVENAPHEELKKMAVFQGMSTLLDEGLKLVNQDVTTIAEVMRTVYTG
ncbi:MAG: type pilus assembly protein PilB [Actinomycetota bacterium]|jgi:type IV pilus assembly protein PilB